MLRRLRDAITPSKGSSLARAFKRLGWTGFWVQLVFGSIPVIMMAYYLLYARSASRSGVPFIEYLTIANLLILVFTLFWSYRYTRLAKQIMDPERRPSESYVLGSVWTGVVASTVGMLFSMVVLLIEAANLLWYFLKAPQAGMQVIQTSGTESVRYVSAVDMVSLMALILALFSELIVLVLSLWLLFRTTLRSTEFPETATAEG
jgi:hypothetical protein